MHIQGVIFMPDSLRLFWDHSVHFAKFPIFTIFETVLFSQLLSNFIHPNFKQDILIMEQNRLLLFGHLIKIKELWHFDFFLNTGPYAAGNCKCYFSHNFHWSPSKLYENIGYLGKSKCLYEWRNEKLASST